MRKFIFISGGVISGIGKGITASSIGVLLKNAGYKITMIKADPYLNVDAGTMNPIEHGETFVLEDGFETDMDIGSYERFTNEKFGRENSMTLGAVLQKVIKDERELAYEGKWVSFDYHVPEQIVAWIKQVGENRKADIVIVEIGGTVGEIGNNIFLEANRMMAVENPRDVVHVHVSYLPVPKTLGEMKSKPVQMSVKVLHSCGINPDFIIARANEAIDEVRMEKLSRYCSVKAEHIIPAPDIDNIYQCPINYEKHDLTDKIRKSLGLRVKEGTGVKLWKKRYESIGKIKNSVDIAIVAKYYRSGAFNLKDSYVSVLEAINHAAWKIGVNVNLHWFVSEQFEKNPDEIKKLSKMDGIVVPQGWGSRGVEGKIMAVKYARENKIPYLGLCFGMQMAVIEYARNVLGLKDANSEEVNSKSKNQVVHMMEEQKKHIKMKNFGGTIRLGAWPCKLKKGTILEKAYRRNKDSSEFFSYNDKNFEAAIIYERHRHRYEFNNEYRDLLEREGLVISGTSPDGTLVEAIELSPDVHPFFLATQYHPELKTSFLCPNPVFEAFIKAVRAAQ